MTDELLCICDDTTWLVQVYVNNTLMHEAIIDASLPPEIGMKITADVRQQHEQIVQLAEATGNTWEIHCVCPGCKRGTIVRPNGEEVTLDGT